MRTNSTTAKKAAGRSEGAAKKSSANGSAKKAAAKAPKGKNTSQGGSSSKLQELLEDELKDIYWAEKALTKAIPKMIKNASAEELVEALENHLQETEGQVERLEQIFEALGKKPQAKKCEAMDGLIKEAEELMADADKGVMRDAAIISAGQKVEHYEIASYGTMRAFAEILGLEEVAALLEETLEEEKAADEKLTEVTSAIIVMEDDDDSEEDDEE